MGYTHENGATAELDRVALCPAMQGMSMEDIEFIMELQAAGREKIEAEAIRQESGAAQETAVTTKEEPTHKESIPIELVTVRHSVLEPESAPPVIEQIQRLQPKPEVAEQTEESLLSQIIRQQQVFEQANSEAEPNQVTNEQPVTYQKVVEVRAVADQGKPELQSTELNGEASTIQRPAISNEQPGSTAKIVAEITIAPTSPTDEQIVEQGVVTRNYIDQQADIQDAISLVEGDGEFEELRPLTLELPAPMLEDVDEPEFQPLVMQQPKTISSFESYLPEAMQAKKEELLSELEPLQIGALERMESYAIAAANRLLVLTGEAAENPDDPQRDREIKQLETIVMDWYEQIALVVGIEPDDEQRHKFLAALNEVEFVDHVVENHLYYKKQEIVTGASLSFASSSLLHGTLHAQLGQLMLRFQAVLMPDFELATAA